MWKKVDGKLVHVTDDSRVKFRTNVSKQVLDELRSIAKKHRTHVNYLLETGLEETLSLGAITIDKKARPKDRVQYKTTYDRDLLEAVREFSIRNNVFVNDVIEYSVQFIDIESSKRKGHKHRIEQG